MMWTTWEIPSQFECEEISSEASTTEHGVINIYDVECKYPGDLAKLLQDRGIPYKVKVVDDNECWLDVNGTPCACDLDGFPVVRVSLTENGAIAFAGMAETLTYLELARAFYKEYNKPCPPTE